MSSSSITVKPRRRPTQTQSSAKSTANQNQGTVLVRNPLPKYSFQQKLSIPKDKNIKKSVSGNKVLETSKDDDSKGHAGETKEELNTKSVDAREHSGVKTDSDGVTTSELGDTLSPLTITTADVPFNKNETMSMSKTENGEKPVNKVGPISKNTGNTLTHSVSDSVINVQARASADILPQPESSTDHTVTNEPPVSQSSACENCQTVTSSENVSGKCTGCKCAEKVQHLEEEKQMLKNQLEVQLQVNQELKKLLVASVGEDLQHRVERLTRDKALLSLEIGDYSKKICDDYEHLDKISIQADMWRSKYLACRVMSDELASSKAFYTMQFQESQLALEKMLNERHQLRANLYDTYRGLEQVQEAFDPLRSQTTGSRLLASKNVIDLARTNQQLVESIKYRLLPSHVTSVMSNKLEPDWHDYLTQAEAHANELLSREMRPEDFRCLVPSRSLMPAPGAMSVDRFHPFVNYDNLTLSVCCKCKGEIRIV